MDCNRLTAIAALAVAVAGREREARERVAAAIERLPKYRRPCWLHREGELRPTPSTRRPPIPRTPAFEFDQRLVW